MTLRAMKKNAWLKEAKINIFNEFICFETKPRMKNDSPKPIMANSASLSPFWDVMLLIFMISVDVKKTPAIMRKTAENLTIERDSRKNSNAKITVIIEKDPDIGETSETFPTSNPLMNI